MGDDDITQPGRLPEPPGRRELRTLKELGRGMVDIGTRLAGVKALSPEARMTLATELLDYCDGLRRAADLLAVPPAPAPNQPPT